MIYLIKDVEVYAPEELGKKQILLGGEEILAVMDDADFLIKRS